MDKKRIVLLSSLFVAISLLFTSCVTSGKNGIVSEKEGVSIKTGYYINECLLELGAGEGNGKSFEPSATAPSAEFETKLLSEDYSKTEIVAWCDGNTIWYYAAGYTDIEDNKIPLYFDSSAMFLGCSKLIKIDLSKFDTSDVGIMENMFSCCSSLKEIVGLNMFNTSNVVTTQLMFFGCESLETLDLSSFDLNAVKDLDGMFFGCVELSTIYVAKNTDWNLLDAAAKPSSTLFSWCFSLGGGEGTYYDDSHTDVAYAPVDGGESNPGYFTVKP